MEGLGEEQRQGRQRLHTRLYPVEISRALKSSESMLPVCFCSQDAGIAEARPTVGPMCTADRQHSGGSREAGGPERPGKGDSDQRDMRARETAGMAGGTVRGRGEEREKEEQLMPQSAGAPGCAYLPVILHVVAQADEAGLEFLRPQCPAMVLPGAIEGRCTGAVQRPGHRSGRRARPHAVGRGGGHMGKGNTQLEVM